MNFPDCEAVLCGESECMPELIYRKTIRDAEEGDLRHNLLPNADAECTFISRMNRNDTPRRKEHEKGNRQCLPNGNLQPS